MSEVAVVSSQLYSDRCPVCGANGHESAYLFGVKVVFCPVVSAGTIVLSNRKD